MWLLQKPKGRLLSSSYELDSAKFYLVKKGLKRETQIDADFCNSHATYITLSFFMKWYNKTISPRTSNIILYSSLSLLMIIYFIKDRNERYKLYTCSIYTVGKISRVHTLRGYTHATYNYRINAKTVEEDENVTNFDTDEPWAVDLNKLSKRRLLLRVYCNDINVHRIVWDVAVPDTL